MITSFYMHHFHMFKKLTFFFISSCVIIRKHFCLKKNNFFLCHTKKTYWKKKKFSQSKFINDLNIYYNILTTWHPLPQKNTWTLEKYFSHINVCHSVRNEDLNVWSLCDAHKLSLGNVLVFLLNSIST